MSKIKQLIKQLCGENSISNTALDLLCVNITKFAPSSDFSQKKDSIKCINIFVKQFMNCQSIIYYMKASIYC